MRRDLDEPVREVDVLDPPVGDVDLAAPQQPLAAPDALVVEAMGGSVTESSRPLTRRLLAVEVLLIGHEATSICALNDVLND